MALFNGRAEDIENNKNKVDVINDECTSEQYPSALAAKQYTDAALAEGGENIKADTIRYMKGICSNAISEYREGEIIGLQDVSPFTDDMTAQLIGSTGVAANEKLYVVGKNLWTHGTQNIVERAKTFDVDLRPGTYTLSAAVSTTYTGSSSIRIHDQTNNALLGFLTKDVGMSSLTFTLSSPCKKITLYAGPDYVTSAGQTATYNIIQIEASSSASDYQPYIEPIEYTPDENGIVSGIVPIYEGMTMYSDDNVLVTVTYNKDLQKVLESITNAIISLGGTI